MNQYAIEAEATPDKGRRTIIQSILGGFLVICGATFIGPVISFLSPRRTTGGREVLQDINGGPIRMSDLDGKPFLIGMGLDGEATIVLRYGGELRAFSAVCPHLGCLVKWEAGKSEFLCPCHAGRFDANGVVVSGPPPAPLKRFRAFATAEGLIGLERKEA